MERERNRDTENRKMDRWKERVWEREGDRLKEKDR